MEARKILTSSDIVLHNRRIVLVGRRVILLHILVELDAVKRPCVSMRVQTVVAGRTEKKGL